jgi:antitoxin component YwqK of YwqJK toxin-antitoxin module
LYSQNRFEIKNDSYSTEFQVDEGKLHGKYVSYYSNGAKKVEGEFYKNQRFGIWTIWSQEGEELFQRDYANNFVFQYGESELHDLVYVP